MTAHPRYEIALETDGAAVCAKIDALARDGAVGLAFQTSDWLSTLFKTVAPAASATPLLAIARERASGRLALAVPWLVRRKGRISVAELADLDLSDYCAPLLGDAAPRTTDDARQLAHSVIASLDGVDMLRLRKMPATVEGLANPFAWLDGAARSKFNGNRLVVETSVEAFLAARGKKYRKEAERSRRRLEEMGPVAIARARSSDEIANAYAAIERWQERRHRDAGHDYWLDRREVSAFYRDLVLKECDTAPTEIYTMTVGGTFTLLRIADAGEEWSHCSPGRMIVLGAMGELIRQGARVFDMGIGDYPFKRWIGCEPHPLHDLDFARTWKARPHVALARAERAIRANPRALALARRLTGRGSPDQHTPGRGTAGPGDRAPQAEADE